MEVIYNNFASGTMSVAILPADTTIVLDAGQGAFFPTPIVGVQYCVMVLEDISGVKEVVHLTDRSADTLTVTRGEEGTIAQTYAIGSRVELRATAGFLDEFIDSGTF